jgi:glycolate oxidase FAD binding subunit
VEGAVLKALIEACGAERARPAGPIDRVGARASRWVATPPDAPGVAAVLAVAAAHGLFVVTCGAGTKLDWGRPPAQVDILLDTARITGVDAPVGPGDPSRPRHISAGAGTPLRAVHAAAAQVGCRLPLDVGSPAATVGGVLAVDESGPLRLAYGTPRDLVTDLEFVRADGVVIRDEVPQLLGSYGTLGVITRATLRLKPTPSAQAWITRVVRTPLEMQELVSALLAAPVRPAAIEVDLTREAPLVGVAGELAVLVEGDGAEVAARTSAVRRRFGPPALVLSAAPWWWGRYPFGPDDIAVRLEAPVADLYAAIYALRDASGVAATPVRGSVGAGVAHASLPAGTPPRRVAAILAAVQTTLLARGGSCVVLRAPEDVRAELGAGPADVTRSSGVKRWLDPEGRFAPGRLAGGR